MCAPFSLFYNVKNVIGGFLDWIQNVAALTQETCVSTKAGGDVTIPGSISVRSR